jgi:hypothetical protein
VERVWKECIAWKNPPIQIKFFPLSEVSACFSLSFHCAPIVVGLFHLRSPREVATKKMIEASQRTISQQNNVAVNENLKLQIRTPLQNAPKDEISWNDFWK